MTGYDRVAVFYDEVARLMLGRGIVDAQIYLVRHIAAGARILVAGGGTGWILETIAARHNSGLHITYADASAKMVEQARKRNAGNNTVVFEAIPIEQAKAAMYDVVITPFLFDNFEEPMLSTVFSCIERQLQPGGLWLYCDFRNTGNLRYKLLLKVMYIFFGWWCGIGAKKLTDIEPYFAGYTSVQEKTFLNGFVVSKVWKRRQ